MFEKCASCILAIPSDAMQPEHARQLETILPLYDGELLEGFYEDWAVSERERLRDLNLSSLTRLMRYHRRAQESNKASTTRRRSCVSIRCVKRSIERRCGFLRKTASGRWQSASSNGAGKS